MRKMAVIVRGPTASGKSTVLNAVEAACAARRLSYRRVSLDQGWGTGPDERRTHATGPRARYSDLLEPPDTDVLIVELAWGEPANIGAGATLNPREWSELVREGRDVYAIRLSGPRALLSDRRRTRQGAAYTSFEDQIFDHVEDGAGRNRFHAATGFDELVISIDRDRSEAEIAGVVLRFIGLA